VPTSTEIPGQFLVHLDSQMRRADVRNPGPPPKAAMPRARRVRLGGIVSSVSIEAVGSGLILASTSPRRQSLLREAGYVFSVVPSEVDEDDYPPTLLPAELALFLARVKARRVAEKYPENVVLSADTVVAFGDQAMGKPSDADDARQMLRFLSGTTQVVVTAVAVAQLSRGLAIEKRVLSAVRMRSMTDAELDRYIQSGLWQGKAGGYGVQDNNPFISGITGCRTNVIGLPMSTTRTLLGGAGIQPSSAPPKN